MYPQRSDIGPLGHCLMMVSNTCEHNVARVFNFWASIFILPQEVIQQVTRLCRAYIWGTMDSRRKLALVFWEDLCTPKKFGDLN